MRVPVLVIAAILLPFPALSNGKGCRLTETAPGVRVAPPGCLPAVQAKPASAPLARVGQDAGFIDIGNGTQVRIGGRVRAEAAYRR